MDSSRIHTAKFLLTVFHTGGIYTCWIVLHNVLSLRALKFLLSRCIIGKGPTKLHALKVAEAERGEMLIYTILCEHNNHLIEALVQTQLNNSGHFLYNNKITCMFQQLKGEDFLLFFPLARDLVPKTYYNLAHEIIF